MKCPYMIANPNFIDRDWNCYEAECAWWRTYRGEEFCGMTLSQGQLDDNAAAINYRMSVQETERRMFELTVEAGERNKRNAEWATSDQMNMILIAVKKALKESKE